MCCPCLQRWRVYSFLHGPRCAACGCLFFNLAVPIVCILLQPLLFLFYVGVVFIGDCVCGGGCFAVIRRWQLRSRLGIQGNLYEDCALHCCIHKATLCQEAQEIENASNGRDRKTGPCCGFFYYKFSRDIPQVVLSTVDPSVVEPVDLDHTLHQPLLGPDEAAELATSDSDEDGLGLRGDNRSRELGDVARATAIN